MFEERTCIEHGLNVKREVAHAAIIVRADMHVAKMLTIFRSGRGTETGNGGTVDTDTDTDRKATTQRTE